MGERNYIENQLDHNLPNRDEGAGEIKENQTEEVDSQREIVNQERENMDENQVTRGLLLNTFAESLSTFN